ncbi:hypothetical protein HanIR_Chr02g0064571 [Helianthus annuus]|nr:hypothetical protein HanIR_Chr02g0064571 [Helianthus annuus]
MARDVSLAPKAFHVHSSEPATSFHIHFPTLSDTTVIPSSSPTSPPATITFVVQPLHHLR